MLSISKIKSSKNAGHYYEKDDYYAKDDPNHKKLSQWFGNGAKDLNLKGNVQKDQFQAILDGHLPGGTKIGIKKDGKLIHDPGRDLTFSAPKSVSIMALIYNDTRLLEAHDKAVLSTLEEIEENYFYTRIKQGKNFKIEKINHLIGATFRHHLSRDLDPQLHTHSVIANITKDKNGKFKSALFDKIYDNKKHLGMIYRSNLAFEVKKLGYEIEINGKECFFEINSVPKEIRDIFSSRSKKIREFSGQNASQKELEKAALLTRNPKKQVSKENYQQIWQEKIKEFYDQQSLTHSNHNTDKSVNTISTSQDNKNSFQAKYKTPIIPKEIISITTKQTMKNAVTAVNHAIKHLSERQTVFTYNELCKSALSDKLSETLPKNIGIAINLLVSNHQLLIKKSDSNDHVEKTNSDTSKLKIDKSVITYTTPDLLKNEIAILNLMKEGKQKHQPIITGKIDKYLSSKYLLDPKAKLNNGQKKCVKLILTTTDRVIGIQGYAGVGKTYMLKAVKEIAANQGYELIGLAPTGVAARNLNNEAGIRSETLESFFDKYNGVINGRGTKEGRETMKAIFAKKIVIVDEAGMISSAQMKNLLTIAKELNFKQVLAGDDKQLDAVGAGTPFNFLQKSGMQTAKMTNIIRQTNPELKNAVYNIIGQDIKSAFDKMDFVETPREVIQFDDGRTWIEPNSELTTRMIERMADHFMRLNHQQRQSTLIITPANEARGLANDLINEALYKERISQENSNKLTYKLANFFAILKSPLIQNIFNKDIHKEVKEDIIFKDKQLSEEEKTRAYNYIKGDIILFNKNRNYIGVKKNQYCEVTATNRQKNLITIKDQESKEFTFNPIKVKGKSENIYFEVFETSKRIFKPGDIITFNKSFKHLEIINSDKAKIIKVNDSKISLELLDGNQYNRQLTLSKNSNFIKHIDFGYAVTAHKSQGLSYDNVIATAESWLENLTNQKNFYVEVSRARDNVTIFTDSKIETINQLESNTGIKITAIEHQALAKEQFIIKQDVNSKSGRKKANKQKQVEIEQPEEKLKKYWSQATKLPNSSNELHILEQKKENILSNQSLNKYHDLITKKTHINQNQIKKFKVIELSEFEIKERFQTEIKDKLNLNPNTNLVEAIDKAFTNLNKKIRFGGKKEYEICWHGEAGYVRDYKSNNYFSWGVNKLKDDGTFKFKEVSFEEITKNRQEAELRAKQADQAKQQKMQEVALKAAKLFNSYSTSGQSKYLKNKNIDDVKINGIRYVAGNIVVPMRDKNDKIWSLQYIYGDGNKMNFTGGKKQGNFFLITSGNSKSEDKQNINSHKKDTIFLAEGFATAVTVHKATKSPVAVCFDAGNIEHVLVNLKTKHPNSNFIIAADNDLWKGVNTGKEKAELVAQKYNVKVILPEFRYEHKDHLPDDFNDLEKLSGINEVKRQINKSLGAANYKNINHDLDTNHQIQNNNQNHPHLPNTNIINHSHGI